MHVTGTTTCGDFSLCDVATDTCVSTCTNGCVIDSACYGDGQVNPLNPCQVCDPSAVDWSDNDGASCDDGLFCTADDRVLGRHVLWFRARLLGRDRLQRPGDLRRGRGHVRRRDDHLRGLHVTATWSPTPARLPARTAA